MGHMWPLNQNEFDSPGLGGVGNVYNASNVYCVLHV